MRWCRVVVDRRLRRDPPIRRGECSQGRDPHSSATASSHWQCHFWASFYGAFLGAALTPDNKSAADDERTLLFPLLYFRRD